jgi:hypothetical protein
MMIAARILCVLMVSAPVVLPLQPPQAHAHEQTAPVRRAPTSEQQQEKMNAWTVGLIEGAPPLRLAAEKALVVVDEANLLVLPVVTLGTTEKLYLRGADLAISAWSSTDSVRSGRSGPRCRNWLRCRGQRRQPSRTKDRMTLVARDNLRFVKP